MTIDEAIALERQAAKEQRDHIGTWDDEYSKKLEAWAEEHEQIAKWLEELKDYQDKNKMVVRVDIENTDSIKDKIDELSKYAESQYNKAIDDFVKYIDECSGWTQNCIEHNIGLTVYTLHQIAEQLKGKYNEQRNNNG